MVILQTQKIGLTQVFIDILNVGSFLNIGVGMKMVHLESGSKGNPVLRCAGWGGVSLLNVARISVA